MGQITQLSVNSPLQQVLYFDSAIGNIVDGIKSGPGLVYSVSADNSGNNVASFIRLFDLNSASVVVGISPPDFVLKCLPNVVNVFYFSNGKSCGLPFGVAISACATTTGGTSGSTSPTNPMKVTITYA